MNGKMLSVFALYVANWSKVLIFVTREILPLPFRTAMEKVIEEIRELSKRLIEDRDALRKEFLALSQERDSLQEALNHQQAQIAELEEENQHLKIAKSLNGTGEPAEAKQKINELVREIDRCIALLNT